MERLGYYVEDEGKPIALKQYMLDTATINKWSPLEESSPATITTVTTSLSSMVSMGHEENDGDLLVSQFDIEVSSMR